MKAGAKAYNRILLAILATVLTTSAIFIGYSRYKKEEVVEEPQVILAIDRKSPEVILNKEIRIKQDDPFVIEDYCKALDLSDVFTTISGNVDVSTVGNYPISLTVTDEYGNMTIARTLVVVEPIEVVEEVSSSNTSNNTNKSDVIKREVNHTNDSGVSPPASQNNLGGDTQTTQPEYNPPYISETPSRGPYIDGVRDISVPKGTDYYDLLNKLQSNFSDFSGSSIGFDIDPNFNTNEAGSTTITYYGSDGATAMCTVIVYE